MFIVNSSSNNYIAAGKPGLEQKKGSTFRKLEEHSMQYSRYYFTLLQAGRKISQTDINNASNTIRCVTFIYCTFNRLCWFIYCVYDWKCGCDLKSKWKSLVDCSAPFAYTFASSCCYPKTPKQYNTINSILRLCCIPVIK